MMRVFPVVAISVGLLACREGSKGDAATDPAVQQEAQHIWTTRCVTCHGEDGRGNGPGAGALNPKPRTFTDPAWQMQTKDERIKKVIVDGGASVGLSPLMAANPDLEDKPAVVAELVAIVRDFK
jgi:mono/diheme cytochrome c family protein